MLLELRLQDGSRFARGMGTSAIYIGLNDFASFLQDVASPSDVDYEHWLSQAYGFVTELDTPQTETGNVIIDPHRKQVWYEEPRHDDSNPREQQIFETLIDETGPLQDRFGYKVFRFAPVDPVEKVAESERTREFSLQG